MPSAFMSAQPQFPPVVVPLSRHSTKCWMSSPFLNVSPFTSPGRLHTTAIEYGCGVPGQPALSTQVTVKLNVPTVDEGVPEMTPAGDRLICGGSVPDWRLNVNGGVPALGVRA